ncbi:hypothetical protein AB6A23_09595 [Paenibacillus tarimensis]
MEDVYLWKNPTLASDLAAAQSFNKQLDAEAGEIFNFGDVSFFVFKDHDGNKIMVTSKNQRQVNK